MSYPNAGGYNAAQMSYSGGTHPNYPGVQQGGYGASAPGGYGHYPGDQGGGYPNQPGGYPNVGGGQHPGGVPTVSPDVQRWFATVDRDHSGKISAKELQAALVNGQGKNFSDQACSLMIGMFDRDKSGTIDVQEFQQLFNYINQWIGTFRTYDRDNSGHIEEAELSQAFQQMGFRFSPEFIKFLISKSDLQNHAKITVDQFIVLCVQVQRFTELGSYHSTAKSFFDKGKRKRKHKPPDNEGPDDDEIDEETENCEGDIEKVSNINLADKFLQESKHELVQLKAELNQLVTENVQLIRENKQLQEENRSLERRAAHLEEENEKLQREYETALELSSWLSSAKEIVQGLKRGCVPSKKPSRTIFSRREDADNETEPLCPTPTSNGGASIKQERLDEQGYQGEESPYHTPLLNFDQVDFPKEEPFSRPESVVWEKAAETDHPVEERGRDQLLHPDLVDGVCELCPGSRIFVSLSAMENIMNKRTHSSVARSCLEAIFKSTYLLSCSVQGNIAKGPYGKPEFQRPSLYKPAVECILRFAKYYAERNGWKIEEVTTIKKQMNTRLSELRNIAKSKNAVANVSHIQNPEATNPHPDNT